MNAKLLLFFLLTGSVLTAQSVRKYSNEFLNIGVDAAAFGMANSVVATTNDVNASYWNPAGLMDIEDNEIALMHASYFANIANYDYLAGAMPIDDRSAVGFSVIRFGVDNIMNTTQLIEQDGQINYDNITYFSAADYAFNLSYARNVLLIDGLSYGVNAKVIRRIIGEFATSWGFGFDAGIQYKTDRSGWRFGAMARDITTTYNTWTIDEDEYSTVQEAVEGQNQELPETTEITLPKLQLGVAKTFTVRYDFDVKAEFDMHMRFAETNDIISTSSISATPSFGFEVGYIDLVYLRGGVGNFQNVEQFDSTYQVGFQPGFGVGFQYRGIHLDYAFTDIGDQSVALYSNVFSLKIDWSLFR
ncbi:PorV/PorQ family protein [Mesonia sp.]|uniref:putative type IX sorting system protein PorV2 n=1 Tax=Mesonia sp. TaxID=1960830 RepID=UPI0025C14D27|nr:PorV/PorQ family protein [Mesonia sp.]